MKLRQVSHYKVIREVGSGGMGRVYLAEDTRLGRKVAVKILPEEASSDPAKVGRFDKEARAASALNHPNILTVFDVGELESNHYIVTEFVEGITLRDRLAHGGITLQNALAIITQVGKALATAHGAGIVHRDIKPENIMVRADGLVKVLEFGLAKLIETGDAEATLEATAPGLILGTPKYMSPEQVRGMDVDHRSDIFSLGVVFYELVAGFAPFDGATVSDVIAAVLKEEPRELRELNPAIPLPVAKVIGECLRKARDERYQSMRSLVFDLEGLSTGAERIRGDHSSTLKLPLTDLAGSHAYLPAKTQDAHVTKDPTEATLTAAYSPIKPGQRLNVWKLIAGSSLALTLIAVLAVFLGQRSAKEEPPDPPPPELQPKIKRLTTNGKATEAVVSLDGKYLAYAVEEGDKQSLWVRHVPTAKNLEIIPPSESSYGDLEFSADANTVFYLKSHREISTSEIYSVPVLGGTQRKVVGRTNNSFAISPDGSQVVFSRFSPDQGDLYTIIANTDGSDERTIDTRTDGSWIDYPSWSPDGSRIVFASGGQWDDRVRVLEIQVADLQKRTIGEISFYEISHLIFRPDGLGILTVARDGEFAPSQIWEISHPGGSVRKLTNDLNNYAGASVPRDLSEITTIQSVDTSGIWLAEGGDAETARQITSGPGQDGQRGICWTPGGQIVYTTFNEGRHDLWIMNADGTNQKQLTANSGSNLEPDVSRDGRYIAFVSNRGGDYHIWRMDVDGNNPLQLSAERPGRFPVWSADGQWIVFQPLVRDPGDFPKPSPLWKVSVNASAEEKVTEVNAAQPAISADGKTIAFFTESEISMMPVSGGQMTQVLRGPKIITGIGPALKDFPLRLPYFRWMPDGSGISFVEAAPERLGLERSSLWVRSFAGGPPKRLSNYDGSPVYFSWSPAGRRLAFSRSARTRDVVAISGWNVPGQSGVIGK